MGVCLPLAVVVGYFLAQPLQMGSLAVLVLIFSVLCLPLFIKWYHPITILGWNICINPFFFPGQLNLWIITALAGFFFAALNRSVNPERRFISVPSLTKPLLFILIVVMATAMLRGGIGFAFLGSSQYGGKRYIFILAAVAGYFALTSLRIALKTARAYMGMFFLTGLTGFIGNLAYLAGPAFYFLFVLFPPSVAPEQGLANVSEEPSVRLGGLGLAAAGFYSYLLARYGFRGLFDLGRPWRLLLFIIAVIGCVGSGFRSAFIMFGLTMAVLFFIEGLHRTRWLPVCLGLGLAGALIVLPQAYRLPWQVQRSLSFLPANVDPAVAASAKNSSDWRVEIWKDVLPEIPRYLLKGKGYAMDPNDLLMEEQFAFAPQVDPYAGVKASGNYHNGPLSVIIPFGIFGTIGFAWFLAAAVRVLFFHLKHGDESLRNINGTILALFISHIIAFCFVFGGFYGDLFIFTGLAGLSVSLNGAPKRFRVEEKSGFAAIDDSTDIAYRKWEAR
jgi:hypothetical protein